MGGCGSVAAASSAIKRLVYMRQLFAFMSVCLVGLSQVQCTPTPASAENPRNVKMSLIATQAFDSIGAVVTWASAAPSNPRQYPLAGYNVRLVRDAVGDTLASSFVDAPGLIDTLWMDMPPLGDTLVFYAAVNARDTHGQESETWGLSDPFVWVTEPLLPNTPGGVNVDTTIGALIIDSLQLIARDGIFATVVGDTTRLAAVLYSGPWPVECCCTDFSDPIGTHPCDAVELVTLSSVLPPEQEAFKFVRAAHFEGHGRALADTGTLVRTEYMRWHRAKAS